VHWRFPCSVMFNWYQVKLRMLATLSFRPISHQIQARKLERRSCRAMQQTPLQCNDATQKVQFPLRLISYPLLAHRRGCHRFVPFIFVLSKPIKNLIQHCRHCIPFVKSIIIVVVYRVSNNESLSPLHPPPPGQESFSQFFVLASGVESC
jgi:hypothetical protein